MNSTELKSAILEGAMLNESLASQQAKALGMQYVGFGRWSDGSTTYKSTGDNLIPMNKSKKKKSGDGNDFITKFIKKSNSVAEKTKSGKSLMEAMIEALPSKEFGEEYGTKEALENILNQCMQYFNQYVINALKNEGFRKTLLKKYLEKFTEESPEQQENPEQPQQITQPQQPQQQQNQVAPSPSPIKTNLPM